MRFELSRATDVAVRAIRALAAGGRDRASLAQEVGTTPDYLARVMGRLVAAGWVASTRGPGGGYRLVAAPSSMLELIEATEGSFPEDRCVLRGGPCPGDVACAVHDGWTQARAALLRALAGTPVITADEEVST